MGGAPVADGKLFYALAPPSAALCRWSCSRPPRRSSPRRRSFPAPFRSFRRRSGSASFRGSTSCTPITPTRARSTFRSSTGCCSIGCVALVLAFGSSAALAAAYGLAVSGVMVITSVAMIPVALRHWHWSPATTALVWGPLTALNAAFLVASSAEALRRRLRPDRGRQRWPSRRWRPGAGAARRPMPRITPRRQ